MMNETMRLLLLVLAIGYAIADEEQCAGGDYRCEHAAAVRRLAASLSGTLRELVAQELGADLAALGGPAARAPPSHATLVSGIAAKLRRKLAAAQRLLPSTPPGPASFTRPCPYASLHADLSFKTYLPFDNTSVTEDEEQGVNELKIRRQYFLSDSDYATDEYCMSMGHSNLRFVYHKVVHPDPKLVVFIVDNSIDRLALQHAVDIVKEITQALQASDMFVLKMTNTTDFVKFEDLCSAYGTSDIGNATDNNKLLLKEYVSTIDIAQTSVPLPIIAKELKILLQKSHLPQNKLIIFMTDTKVTTKEVFLSIFPNMKDENIKFAISVLEERALRLNSSSEIEVEERWSGVRLVRGSTRARAGRLASALLGAIPRAADVTAGPTCALLEPAWEAPARDFTVSLVRRAPAGVLGLDLYWSDLAEDLLYFRRTAAPRRAFVIDFSSKVIMHSDFPRPELTTEKIKFSSLNSVENYEFIDRVKEQLLTKDTGTMIEWDEASNKSITYTWENVLGLYVVCVVGEEEHSGGAAAVPVVRANRDILFHRLDLLPPRAGALCRHFKQLATLQQATLYLSPSSFRSPFAYLSAAGDGPEALADMQNYLAYLKSVANGLLANPGLAAGVRQDAGLLNTLAAYYRRQALRGARARHVVRRYAAAASGALLAYPGALLPRDYEPTRREWYARAVAAAGRATLSPPRLDAAGAGYVVTLSAAPARAPLVLAADLPLGYVARELARAQPLCAARGMRCFLMNERGYLVSHPALLGPAAQKPLEQQHVTHKESVIATDMLSQRGLVSKRVCWSAFDRTTQRYYEFNASAGVVGGAAAGEPCVHYYAAGVPGTDLLVALVNATCNAEAFCPCSVVDRLCLNCNRMEQSECECPCECGAPPDSCPASSPTAAAPPALTAPACPPPLEPPPLAAHYYHEPAETLKPCFELECEAHGTHAACLGLVGCEWCQASADGQALPTPFCAPQAACFGGVLGAVTPYGGGAGRGAASQPAWSAAGPAAGCLVAAGLVGALAAYCCRVAGTSGSRRALYAAAPREPWPEPAEASAAEEAGRERLLPAPVSPYRVLAGVRRARRAGSDHGYSTMTPHEDSEATAPGGEGAPLSDDTRSDTSCPLTRPAAVTGLPGAVPAPPAVVPGTTTLPCGRLLAPVTVHRHMEAS